LFPKEILTKVKYNRHHFGNLFLVILEKAGDSHDWRSKVSVDDCGKIVEKRQCKNAAVFQKILTLTL